jgi:hypothetical protein
MDTPQHPSALKNAFESLGPSSETSEDYTIAMQIGCGYLARARSGMPTFLVPLATVPSSVGRRGGGFSLTPASRVAFTHREHRWEQPAAALECTDIGLSDTFMVLVLDLARRLTVHATEPSWSRVLGWVEEWQALLGRRLVLSEEQQLGLWGELWVLSQATAPDTLIAGWRGPERAAVDFFLNGLGLEVKTSRRAHIHHVSSSQVDAPLGDHSAYLLSMWVSPEPVRGLSLAELVETLMLRVADPSALLKKIALAGYLPSDRNQYSMRYVTLEAPLWFHLEDIPRVRDADAGISQLRYVITLDTDLGLNAAQDDKLWHHFCQTEPPHRRKAASTS